jgi:hypothetical protein
MAEQVEVNSREIACECMNRVDVAQGRMQCLAGCCGAGEETLGFFLPQGNFLITGITSTW